MDRPLGAARAWSALASKRQLREGLLDISLIAIAYYAAYRLRFDAAEFGGHRAVFVQALPIVVICQFVSLLATGAYRDIWYDLRLSDITRYSKGILLGTASSIIVLLYLYRFQSHSRVVFLIYAVLLAVLMIASRVMLRALVEFLSRNAGLRRRAVIYGAGDGGILLARELLSNPRRGYRPIGFIDDDPQKAGRAVIGLPILGGLSVLPMVLARYGAQALILSTRKIEPAHLRQLPEICITTRTALIAMRFNLDAVEIDGGAVLRFPGPFDRSARKGPADLERSAAPERADYAEQGQEAASAVGMRSDGVTFPNRLPARGVAAGIAVLSEGVEDIVPYAPHIRVAHVVTRLNVGGVTRDILNLYRYMPADRVESCVIAGSLAGGETEMTEAIRTAGAAPMSLPQLRREIAPIDDLIALFKLWRFFRQWKPDVVHTHMAKAGALGRLAAVMAGAPVRVHSYHGHVFHGYFGRAGSFAARAIERVLGRITSGVVTLTPAQHEEIVGQLRIVPAPRASLIPYGCDISERAADELTVAWRRNLGIAEDAFVALSVGRLVPIKNHELLLQALAQCGACSRITAVIVGDGELRPQLEQQALALGVGNRVVFAGWRNDVAIAYQAADVLALTSRNEGSPLAVMEAMGSGCPVVATRVGGVPDLVDEASAILVDDNDAAGLATALCALAQDPHRVRRMGTAALARARAKFSVDREAASMLSYYRQLLQTSRLSAAAPTT